MIPINYNLRSLAVRRTTTAAAVLGIALVVAVLGAALMMSDGIEKTLAVAGRSDDAIVLRSGANTEMASGIDTAAANVILAKKEVKQDASGKPMGVAEIVVVAAMDVLAKPGEVSNVMVRGIADNAWDFRPEVKIIDGRKPQPGTDEVAVGKAILGQFVGLQKLGDSFELRKNRPVKVVGVFSAEGSSYESEVWMDVDTLAASFNRQGSVCSVRVRLNSPSDFDAFKTDVESDKQLGLVVKQEPHYYEEQSEDTSSFIRILGSIIAGIFAFGAVLGAMITMYASIAARQREVGILRALGFSPMMVLSSFLLESLLIALIGGALGLAVCLALSGSSFSTMNFASWSQMTFGFHATGWMLVKAVGLAGVMGVVGGLLPAIRAARISPALAMRGG